MAIRSLHNAAIEDCFDQATISLGIQLERPARWSAYVRLLRALMQIIAPSKQR
jgi:hypothetical protein